MIKISELTKNKKIVTFKVNHLNELSGEDILKHLSKGATNIEVTYNDKKKILVIDYIEKLEVNKEF